MHLLKPEQLGFSARPIEFRRRFGLSVSAYLYVPFDQGEEGHLWTEPSMWEFLGATMQPPLIDEGVFKRTSEYLVHGFAYPESAGDGSVAAQVRFAGNKKTLLAFGNRYWDGSKPSPPKSFESIPLHWSRAYGGQDYAINPQGMGRCATDGVHWLPNLELPHSRLTKPSDEVVPAGLGSLDVMHPQRASFRGTYDQNWLKDHSPGLPPDADWKFFNMAPRDQWLDAPLKGDEPFQFHHMHPVKALVSGALPGLRVRVFANQQTQRRNTDTLAFREVSMQLTTVWFFPHVERAVIVFQGMVRTLEDDGSDVRHVLAAVERLGEARSDEHYLDQFQKRTTGKNGGIMMLNHRPLLPEGVSTFDPEMKAKEANFAFEGFKEEAQHRKACADIELARQQARKRGADPDALGIKAPARERPPAIEDLPEYLEKVERQKEDAQWQAMEDLVTHLEKAVERRKQGKLDPEQLLSRGPPKFRARDEYQRQRTAVEARGRSLDEPDDLKKKLTLVEMAHRENYRKSAHQQAPAFRIDVEAARVLRSEIDWLSRNGHRVVHRIDLTGADLSGLDLRGMDFSEAWLESVDFSGSNLSRARFDDAVLAHCNFSDTICVNTSFARANLGSIHFRSSVLARSRFDHAIMMGSRFEELDMRWARLTGANLLETQWSRVDLSEAEAPEMLFHQLSFDECLFSGAFLNRCIFLECQLRTANFESARLQSASFMQCDAQGTHFQGADLSSAVLGSDSNFSSANFESATMNSANLGESELGAANLRFAALNKANLTRTRLPRANLQGADLKGALLRKTDLSGAIASDVDFKDAVLQGAIMEGGDFRSSHFFGADLSRVELDRASKFDQSVFERARIHPRFEADPATGADR